MLAADLAILEKVDALPCHNEDAFLGYVVGGALLANRLEKDWFVWVRKLVHHRLRNKS